MALKVYDYECRDCRITFYDKLVRDEEKDDIKCPCGKTLWRLPALAKIDWDSLARGDNASPEAKSHFARKRRQQKTRETRAKVEHGDYGSRPGAD
ncbi:MAG: zinc ribbon domain-containing protein [Myxococcota bacterium]|nr:zinc ribbon domain-containing protein [Myxococcota bacterium]